MAQKTITRKDDVVYISTGKKCSSCSGTIVEGFEQKSEPFTMHTVIGSRRPTWIESTGFSCNKCGMKYGAPVFKATTSSAVFENVKFILHCIPATLSKTPPQGTYSKRNTIAREKKFTSLKVGNQKIRVRPIKDIDMSRPEAPPESILKRLRVGAKIYIFPSGDNFYNFFKKEFHHATLRLDVTAPTFYIPRSCVSIKK